MDAVIEAKVAGLEPKLAEHWDGVKRLAAAFPGQTDGRRVDDPLPDAYCAAYSMRNSPAWQPSPSHEKLYRGQRDHRWSVTPSLYRESGNESTIQAKLDRVRDFVRTLEKHLTDLAEDQLLAVAQHYSHEAGIQTWLIDVTWDPLVALSFASDGGKAGDRGVVSYYTNAEWNKFSAGGKNLMGPIRVIEVPGIRRIAAQRALFIDTSHPEFFERLVPFSIWFRQQPGLMFEDETLAWPISRRTIYPLADETEALVRKLKVVPSDKPLAVTPRGNPDRSLTADDYLAQADSWLLQSEVHLRPENRNILGAVCRFYAALGERKAKIELSLRSLHRLREAFNRIVYAEKEDRIIKLREAIEATLSRSAAREVRDILESVALDLEVETMPSGSQKPGTTERLIRLIDDVGPLHTVNGFGFGSSPSRDTDLENLKRSQFWTFVDLRGMQAPAQLQTIVDHWSEKLLVLVVDREPGTPLARLVKGMIDRRQQFDLGDGTVRSRRKDQTIVLAFPDAESLEDVSEKYHEIPYWSFHDH
jgi:hypothetical protein